MSKYGFLTVRVILFSFLLLFFSVLSYGAQAEVVPGTSCDVEVYGHPDNPSGSSLWARAWMEGKREMEVAQQLIVKPDSVLEYSCFAARRNELRRVGMAWSGSSSFDTQSAIEAGAWAWVKAQALNVLGTSGLGAVITNIGIEIAQEYAIQWGAAQLYERDPMRALIDPVVERYLGQNFYHTLGGGVYDLGPEGVCDAMNSIWNFMKCSNMEEGDFFTLASMLTNDRRTLPGQCPASETEYIPSSGTHGSKWLGAYQEANPLPTYPASEGGIDALLPRLFNYIENDCGEAIPTGLWVLDAPPGDYDPDTENKSGRYLDSVCIAPGCHYVPFRLGGSARGTCQP